MAPAHAGAGIGENDVMSADPGLVQQAKQLLETLQAKNLSVVTAESCTAGMLATLLSEAPGAAEHLHGGFVTYTKANKTKTLGVSREVLARRGAVCREVAIAMAEGALASAARRGDHRRCRTRPR
jgi:nicotinamide-nucleotide amidase